MSDLNLIGAITGSIGAFTGILGLILGYKGYSRSKNIKKFDLRLELRKSVSTLKDDISKLPELIEKGHKSKQAMASAQGWFKSGRMEQWKNDINSDNDTFNLLNEELSKFSENFQKLKESQLEEYLIKAHTLQKKTNELMGKYIDSINEDKEESRLLKQAAEARHNNRKN